MDIDRIIIIILHLVVFKGEGGKVVHKFYGFFNASFTISVNELMSDINFTSNDPQYESWKRFGGYEWAYETLEDPSQEIL